ncbi:SDR family NAD(P)-dependent oxidoreductase [Agromyces soli]|uniref:SDR family oxidoreductase n=1 Tax=Agromyces soli TaxID=659012 RepID=A0ABY4AXN3_9MICO|nr:SDR family oxidoreductase [Agromyces soli]UOE27172.1 SDR family oxidoreductase [Agromyces soli]
MDALRLNPGGGDVAFDFGGRRVLVTGGASGIGLTIAARFAAAGAHPVVVDVDEDALAAVCGLVPGATAIRLDVTDAAAVTDFAAAHGPFDVAVNNAMICGDDDFLSATPEQLRREVDVNLVAPMLVTRAVLPAMVDRGAGAIVNVSSINALQHLGNEAYSAAKAGLQSLTRSVATEYGRHGVRCNAIALGTVDTPYWSERRAADPGVLDRLERWYPLRRIGTPEDAAAAVLFFASSAARWITGAVLTVDGGFTAGNLRMSDDIHGERRD